MENALKHFKKHDPILYEISLKVKLNKLTLHGDMFVDLIETIINQQLSDKAAATIFGRFKSLFPKGRITPDKVLKISDKKIRQAGISYSKIKYIKGIAGEIKNNGLNLKSLENLSDEEVINELIKLKGVGVWTAEMFLMFTLGRPDIFSAGDLGLQNAIIKSYKLKKKPTNARLLKMSIRWSPYRTTASRILWRSLDLK